MSNKEKILDLYYNQHLKQNKIARITTKTIKPLLLFFFSSIITPFYLLGHGFCPEPIPSLTTLETLSLIVPLNVTLCCSTAT